MKKISSPFELVKKSIDIFSKKENLIYLIKVYLPLLPFSIFTVVQGYIPLFVKDPKSVAAISINTTVQILYILVSTFVLGAGILAIGRIIKGENLSVKSVFEETKMKFWRFLLLNIILNIVYILGFILLIIPGVLLVTWFAFAKFIAIEKNLKIKEILTESKNMVKGIFWKVLGRLIVFGFFTLFAQLVLGFIPYAGYIITSLVGSLFLIPTYLLYKELWK